MLDSWEIIWNDFILLIFSALNLHLAVEKMNFISCSAGPLHHQHSGQCGQLQTFLDSVFLTDACMIYAPSQIALAAVIHAASRQKQNLNLCLDATFKSINLNLWKQIVISFSLLFRLWKDLLPMRHPASEWLPAQPPGHVAHLHHQEVGGGQGVDPNTIFCISRQILILLLRSWGGGLQNFNTYYMFVVWL